MPAESPVRVHESVRTVLHPLRSRLLTVTALDELGPRMRRVTLGGPELEDDFPAPPFAAPDHVKIVLPDPATGRIPLPRIVDDRPQRLEGTAPVLRDYTVRRVDAEHLTLDFVLHDHGPAGRWARSARVGDPLGVMGPRGSHVYPADYGRYLLVADETALPAVGRWLEEPGWTAPVTVVALVGSTDEYPLPARPATDIRWHVAATADRPAIMTPLAETMAADAETFLWAAGEADSLKPLRRALREHGIDRARVDIDGYWRQGVAGLDHHAADDD